MIFVATYPYTVQLGCEVRKGTVCVVTNECSTRGVNVNVNSAELVGTSECLTL